MKHTELYYAQEIAEKCGKFDLPAIAMRGLAEHVHDSIKQELIPVETLVQIICKGILITDDPEHRKIVHDLITRYKSEHENNI